MAPVAAVVVTYNNGKTIRACLESLFRFGITDIVVVDNASRDGTTDVVRAYPVQLVQNAENVGFAAASNVGVSTITSYKLQVTDYILFLNPDAVLHDSIDPAIKLLDADKKVGIVGLGLYDSAGNLEKDAFGSEPSLLHLFFRKFTRYRLQVTGYVDWCSGGAMVVRTSAFNQLGGFDEEFFLYWEDVDLCRRVREAGFKVKTMPAIHVMHARGVSLTDNRKKAGLYDQSADRYFQKHYAAPIWIFQRFLRFLYRLFWQQVR